MSKVMQWTRIYREEMDYTDEKDCKLFNGYVDFLKNLTSHEIVNRLYPENIDDKVITKIAKTIKEVDEEWGYTRRCYTVNKVCDLIHKELDVKKDEEKIKWNNLIDLIDRDHDWLECLKIKELTE